jgi:hypothetical protein
MFSRPDIQLAWQRREIAAAIVLGRVYGIDGVEGET